MKQFKYYLMAAFVAAATCTGFSSCSDNDDEESTVNPAVDVVTRTKQHDTAILLCTFGSTYNESLSVYDDVIEEFLKLNSPIRIFICHLLHVHVSDV